MRSAFWRGVMLLKELDSDAGSMAASSGPSRDTEGFSGAPKNVSLLEPAIGKLRDKVACRVILYALANALQDPPKGASPKWVSMVSVTFHLGLVMLHKHLIRTIIGTVFVHISYFPHARCVVSCVMSCVGHVLCCALLRCSTVF
jgi:hypothetical protein